jgi:hypothetical protein
MTPDTFLGAVTDDIGFYLLLFMFLGSGTVVGFFARRSRAALAVVSSALAVALLGGGGLGRSFMLDAAHLVSLVPDLSRADRDEIVRRKEVEASYRLEGAIGAAVLAGLLAVLMRRPAQSAVQQGRRPSSATT